MGSAPDLWRFNWPPYLIAASSAAGLACAALFYLGPALEARQAGSFRAMLHSALGTVPGFCIEIACVVFLVIWTAGLLDTTSIFLGLTISPRPAIHLGLVSGAVLFLVYFTCRSSAVARFTIKLAAALMIAAFIRVRDGWYAIPFGVEPRGQDSMAEAAWKVFPEICAFIAPLALLGAIFSARLRDKRGVKIAAQVGIAGPVAASLALVTVLSVATYVSRSYLPGSFQRIYVSLASGATRAGNRAVLLLFAVTMLGLLRFGVSALKQIATAHWTLFGCLISAIVWLSAHYDPEEVAPALKSTTEILGAVAAILTVDALMRRQIHPPRPFDWPATLSLACAMGIPMFIRFWRPQIDDQYGHPWLLPSYALAFGAHMLARGVERIGHHSPAA